LFSYFVAHTLYFLLISFFFTVAVITITNLKMRFGVQKMYEPFQ
jgi:hypothetical protein